jgi:hypothetical protein
LLNLLNIAVVAFKVLPYGSYAPMPAPSPPFKTIFELLLWNILQNCRRITPDISVISAVLSIFLLSSGREKSHWGLDPVNREGVPAQLIVKNSLTEGAV